MVKRNPNFTHLSDFYLFAEVGRKVRAFQKNFPETKLLSLSIGDTSEPIPAVISKKLELASKQLGTREGYRGYGAEQGNRPLREKIAEVIYHGKIDPEEIFVSDGAKCDIGRLQLLFGSEMRIAVQDPAYPVYVDTSLLLGQKQLEYLPCLPENGFFPEKLPKTDLIYFCSPNNPTGAVATREQLKKLVAHAHEHKCFIIFDAAYSAFIQDPALPKSIYEIEGAKEVAIEVSSFSKLVGFSGVRLGWTVVPKALSYDGGKSVHADWSRIVTTFFNGASNLAQEGGLSALTEGIDEIDRLTKFYLKNGSLLREALISKGYQVHGGVNAPYLWVHFGERSSWGLFQRLLETVGIIATPGVGFGPCGEGFLRFSAFGKKEQIEEAVERIHTQWPENL